MNVLDIYNPDGRLYVISDPWQWKLPVPCDVRMSEDLDSLRQELPILPVSVHVQDGGGLYVSPQGLHLEAQGGSFKG